MEKYEKKGVFLGGYGRIGEIQHGRLRPDWGVDTFIFVRMDISDYSKAYLFLLITIYELYE